MEQSIHPSMHPEFNKRREEKRDTGTYTHTHTPENDRMEKNIIGTSWRVWLPSEWMAHRSKRIIQPTNDDNKKKNIKIVQHCNGWSMARMVAGIIQSRRMEKFNWNLQYESEGKIFIFFDFVKIFRRTRGAKLILMSFFGLNGRLGGVPEKWHFGVPETTIPKRTPGKKFKVSKGKKQMMGEKASADGRTLRGK